MKKREADKTTASMRQAQEKSLSDFKLHIKEKWIIYISFMLKKRDSTKRKRKPS